MLLPKQHREVEGVECISLKEYSSRLEVERLCCGQAKGEKAPELEAAGNALFEIMFKAWAAGEAPASWKGGILCQKGKGTKKDASTYRGVVLLSVLGKRWHPIEICSCSICPHDKSNCIGGRRRRACGMILLLVKA